MIADAYAIFQYVRSAVTSVAYPRRLDYTVAIGGLDGSTYRQNHYHASFDSSDGTIRVLPVSDEELASRPPRPHDFQFSKLVIFGVPIAIGHPPPSPDVIGVPLLSPTYTFGLAYPLPATRKASEGGEGNTLPTIAIVSTKTRDYNVTLLDTPDLDGTPTYHLKLTPLRRPKDNRLRELWIGQNDYLPRKAVVAGNFTIAPLVDVPWTIAFTLYDGAPVIASESADATLYLAHRRVVRNAAIAFTGFHEPSGSLVDEPLLAPEVDDSTLVEPPP